jgi:hypothetical protein
VYRATVISAEKLSVDNRLRQQFIDGVASEQSKTKTKSAAAAQRIIVVDEPAQPLQYRNV